MGEAWCKTATLTHEDILAILAMLRFWAVSQDGQDLQDVQVRRAAVTATGGAGEPAGWRASRADAGNRARRWPVGAAGQGGRGGGVWRDGAGGHDGAARLRLLSANPVRAA